MAPVVRNDWGFLFPSKGDPIRSMATVALILVGFVAIQHLGFLVLESILWKRPIGRKVFRLTEQQAEITAPLAANQGLYNGFLAAGLLVGMFHHERAISEAFTLFFLLCVILAGVFGAWTVSRRILVIQALPATLALLVHLLS